MKSVQQLDPKIFGVEGFQVSLRVKLAVSFQCLHNLTYNPHLSHTCCNYIDSSVTNEGTCIVLNLPVAGLVPKEAAIVYDSKFVLKYTCPVYHYH